MRWLAILVWLTASIAHADPPSRFTFRSYGSEQGLSNLSINAIEQSDDGLLWVATEDGLFGFDGAHFRRMDPDDSLPSTWIFSLLADDGGMWVGTARGLRWIARDRVELGRARGAPDAQVNALAAGPDHRIWAATDAGLVVGRDGAFAAVKGWPGGASGAVWVDRDGSVVAGHGTELATYDVHGRWTVRELGKDRIDQITRTPDGTLWVRSARMLWACEGVATALACRDVSAQLPDVGEAGRMLIAHDGSLWVATRSGLAHRIAEGTWDLLGAKDGLPARSVLMAYQDREDSIWLVADQLYQQLGRGQWRAYAADTGFPADTVWSIARDAKGALLVGTNKGVLEARDAGWVTFPGTEDSTIKAVADAGDVIYAGGLDGRLLVLDRAKRTTTTIERLDGENIVDLVLDHGDLWIATRKAGLWRKTGGVLEREVLPGELPREDIDQVALDPRGWVWAAGSGGLAVRRNGVWRRYTERDGLAARETSYVLVRASGEVCVAYAEAHGASCFQIAPDGSLAKVHHLTHASGLASNKLYVLGEDHAGHLYIGSGVGVDIIEGDNLEHYSTTNGLVGDDCVARAFLADPDGSVMIGTTRGIARFASAQFRSVGPPPPPVVMGVLLDGTRVHAVRGAIGAPHDGAASLSVDFATPTFVDREQLEYQVRLRPLETEWHVASVEQSRYAQLAPGTYHFEVRSRFVPGNFGPTTAFELVIPPAWWQTLWFRLLLAVVIAGVLALVIAWRMRVIATRARLRIVERSEASFRALIVQSPDCVLVHRDGVVIYANARAIALLGSEEGLIGGRLDALVDAGDDVASLIDPGDASPSREVRMRTASGAVVLLEVSALRIDFDGAPAVLTSGRDVTARKAVEARLMFTDRMASIGTLAAGIAHEINNPLAYVQSNLALIGDSVGPDASPSLREAIADAKDGALRIQHIVRGVKTFSRSDDDARTPIRIRDAVESALRMTANELRHRCVIVKDLGDVPNVLGNEARLGQVFINLLVNAAQAMPERSVDANQIRIATFTAANGDAVIEISDNAQGMTPQVARRIFEPFFTTKDIGQGTGLGLSVCHGIITRFGGQITVDSVVGTGTTFRISLPATAQRIPPERAVTNRVAMPDHARLRVLLIDDDAVLLKSIARQLGRDHEVVACSSATEALERLRGNATFEVILCDLMMPGFTGMELHAELENLHPELVGRMLFMTGGAFTPEAQAFLEDPRIRSIEKPFPASDLRERLLEIIASDSLVGAA